MGTHFPVDRIYGARSFVPSLDRGILQYLDLYWIATKVRQPFDGSSAGRGLAIVAGAEYELRHRPGVSAGRALRLSRQSAMGSAGIVPAFTGRRLPRIRQRAKPVSGRVYPHEPSGIER